MQPTWQEMTWAQFGASIDMLANAIKGCSEDLWDDASRGAAAFWLVAYHTIFWLDFYLAVVSAEDFGPPAPFTRSELDESGRPDRVYTPDELLDYLAGCRRKCRATVLGLTDERAAEPCPGDRSRYGAAWQDLEPELGYVARRGMSHGELTLYNLRHVQHHAAQLNLLMRQAMDTAPRWVGRVKE